ncbi:endonuclease domain-containing protein [Streptomyces goshikiensis]|uniref:endonuclease domain-containing protein n=1 Tax=Streptomyces goshikiensis TaxID=1942 RepID=UPI0036B27164
MKTHESCQHTAYRLTCADYDALWEHAEGRCEICRKTPEETPDGRLGIDHAGEYGYFAVRGLLCSKCNTFMRYVDRGQKCNGYASQYLQNAWFVRVLKQRHEDNKAVTRKARKASTREASS